jgi:hypothetical protein
MLHSASFKEDSMPAPERSHLEIIAQPIEHRLSSVVILINFSLIIG